MQWHLLWMARTCRETPDAYCKRCGTHHFLKNGTSQVANVSAWQVCCRVIPYISIQEHSKLKWKIILDAKHITWKVFTTQISTSSCTFSNNACCTRFGAHHFETTAHAKTRSAALEVCCSVISYISIQKHSKLKWNIIFDSQQSTCKLHYILVLLHQSATQGD